MAAVVRTRGRGGGGFRGGRNQPYARPNFFGGMGGGGGRSSVLFPQSAPHLLDPWNFNFQLILSLASLTLSPPGRCATTASSQVMTAPAILLYSHPRSRIPGNEVVRTRKHSVLHETCLPVRHVRNTPVRAHTNARHDAS